MSALDQYLAKPWLKHYQPGIPATVAVPGVSIPQAFDEACGRDPRRTAVAFYGRDISYRELREASDRGIRIPEDLAVIGFDGVPEADQFTPSLTTIAQPLAAIGSSAVDRLLREIEGDDDAVPGADIVMPTQLLIRESAPAVR